MARTITLKDEKIPKVKIEYFGDGPLPSPNPEYVPASELSYRSEDSDPAFMMLPGVDTVVQRHGHMWRVDVVDVFGPGDRPSMEADVHAGMMVSLVDSLGHRIGPRAERITTGNVGGDSVNHPKHYNVHPSGVECIEIVRHMGFNLGNVVKYVWRDGEKDVEVPLEDLKKAAWYLADEIKRKESQAGGA